MGGKKEVITAEKIRKEYGKRKVLSDAWLAVCEGETVSIAGLDGAGRTALMKIIAGVEEKDSGNLYFRGGSVVKGSLRCLRNKVAYITHASSLVNDLSIIDNLYIINRLKSKSWIVRYQNIKKSCQEILKELKIDQSYMQKCSILEDNEKQRLEIMKEIMAGAEVIILNSMRNIYSEQDLLLLKQMMEKMKERGISFIFVSNKLEYMTELSDTMFVMKNGRTVKEMKRTEFNKQLIYSFMSGYHIIDDPFEVNKKVLSKGAEVLRMERVQKGELKEVTLSVRESEIVGILSLSSRWTEDLMHVLMGNERAEAGNIYRNGKKAGQEYLKDRSTPRNKCCIIPQPNLEEEIYQNLSAQQNYILLAQQKTTYMPLGIVSRKIEHYLENTDIKELGFTSDIFHKPVRELTNRERFELVIGRIRLFHPEVLVINSPIEVADIYLKQQIIGDLIKMAEHGTGILITGANYKDLSVLCDRILFQRNGKITGSISRDEFPDVSLDYFLN